MGFLMKDRKDIKLESVLSLSEAIRKNRASRVKILSSARVERESQVAERLVPYLDEIAPKAPMSLAE